VLFHIIIEIETVDDDTCDRYVMYCTQKIRDKEWQPYDISEALELVSRPVKEEYYKVVKDSNDLSLNNEISNYIES